MAEEVSPTLLVSHQPNNTQQQEQEQEQNNEEDDLYAFDFDPLSPPNISFFIPSSHSQNFTSYSDSDSNSNSNSDSDPYPFDEEEEEDQMNFVTDLFASAEEEFVVDDDQDSVFNPFLDQDSNFRVFEGGDEELGLGFGSELGLRVVGIESDSDSEEVIQDDGTGLFWDSLGFEEQRAGNEELEWEELDEMGGEEEREGLSSVIDRIEELSVSSEVLSNEGGGSDVGEEAVRNMEWEVLVAVNNLERASEFEHDGDGDDTSYMAVRDDYIYAAEYDTLFGRFVQNESGLKGSPPAAKSVVENLPSVVLTKEELGEDNVVCAVCKDEILEEEKVTRLPCRHHYHGDCITPWLGIRNTCPVCRYELPTDDMDYEQRKTLREGIVLPEDLQILEFIYRVVEGQGIGV